MAKKHNITHTMSWEEWKKQELGDAYIPPSRTNYKTGEVPRYTVPPKYKTVNDDTIAGKVKKLSLYIRHLLSPDKDEERNKSVSIPYYKTEDGVNIYQYQKPKLPTLPSIYPQTQGEKYGPYAPGQDPKRKAGSFDHLLNIGTDRKMPYVTYEQSKKNGMSNSERGAYDLAKVIAGDKGGTLGGGFRRGTANVAGGILGAGEGIFDFISGGGNTLLGNIASSKWNPALIIAKAINPNFNIDKLSNTLKQNAEQVYNNDVTGAFRQGIIDEQGEGSAAQQFADNLEFAGANMLATMAAGKGLGALASGMKGPQVGSLGGNQRILPKGTISQSVDRALTDLTFGSAVAGQSAGEAYRDGADVDQATAYGIASGILETTVEHLEGGIPGRGKGFLDAVMKKLGNAPTAVKVISDLAGEGLEEVISDIVSPYLQRAIYNPEAEDASAEDLIESFVMGAALAGIAQGSAAVAGGISNVAAPEGRIGSRSAADGRMNEIIAQEVKRQQAAPKILSQPSTAASLMSQSESQSPAVQLVAQNASESYGPIGAHVAVDVFSEEQSPADYYAGFTTFYNAGLQGKKFSTIKGKFVDAVTNTQAKAAYEAGVQDAASSFIRESNAQKTAKVYRGKNAGLQSESSEYVAALGEDVKKTLDKFGSKLGVKVVVDAPTGNGSYNGYYRDGEIHIAADTEDPVYAVLSHESTHRLQELAPEEYRSYRDFAVQAVGATVEGGSNGLIEAIKERYGKAGEQLTNEQAMDEIAANYTAELLENDEEFKKLVSHDRTLAERFLDALRDVIRKIKAAFKGEKKPPELKVMEEAADRWKLALDAAEQNVKNIESQETTSESETSSESEEENEEFKEEDKEESEESPKTENEEEKETKKKKQESKSKRTEKKYSLKADSDGRKLTDQQVKYFENSKARDENGQLLELYHGTVADFTIFDRSFSNPEGDFGSAFYFTNSDYDANKNYGSEEGPDLLLKIGMLADQLWDSDDEGQYEEYEDAEEAAKNFFVTAKPHTLEVYLNITNPVVIGGMDETMFDYYENYNEDEDEYEEPEGTLIDFVEAVSNVLLENDYLDVDESYSGQHLYENVEDEILASDLVELVKEDEELMYATDEDGHIVVNEIIRQAFENMGYDGIIDHTVSRKWGASSRRDKKMVGVEDDTTHFLIFNSSQAKSIDNKNPTSKDDINFSLKGSLELTKELQEVKKERDVLRRKNSQLEKRVDFWRGQLKTTDKIKTSPEQTKRYVKALVKENDSNLLPEEVEELTDYMQQLYDLMANNGEGNNELTFSDVWERAEELAGAFISTAEVPENAIIEYGQDLKDYLESNTIKIPQTVKDSITDYNDFRKKLYGKVKLKVVSNANANLDMVYDELLDIYPDLPADAVAEDQVYAIAEAAEEVYSTKMRNPFAENMDRAVYDLTNRIIDNFFEIPQVKATFADRQAKALAKAKAEGKQKLEKVKGKDAEKYAKLKADRDQKIKEIKDLNAKVKSVRSEEQKKRSEAVKKVREEKNAKIEALEQKNREQRLKASERAHIKEIKPRILRHVSQLSQKLRRPTDTKNVPEALRKTVASVLDAINLESAKLGKDGTLTKRTEAFRKLREEYQNILNNPTEDNNSEIIIDPGLIYNLQKLEQYHDTPIDAMSYEQLTLIWNTIRAMEASIYNTNKMLGMNRAATVNEFANGIRYDNRNKTPLKNEKGALADMLRVEMLKPVMFFKRLGATATKVWDMLRDAWDEQIRYYKAATDAMHKIVGKAKVKKLEREIHTFEIGERNVALSTAQIMSLYELNKRKDAESHIYKGGIRPGTIKRTLKTKASDPNPVNVTPADVSKILSVLDKKPELIAIADKIQQYMANELAAIGNKASMEVYFYEKFTGEDYFPMNVDKNQTDFDTANQAQAGTIAGMGHAKSVNPNASNALTIDSIFDVAADHINEMITYGTWLAPMENLKRVYNYTFWDRNAQGDVTERHTIKEVIEKVYGKAGNRYFQRLMNDLNRSVQSADKILTSGMVGKFKAAAVGANIRVILQQPTSILRAASVMKKRDLIRAIPTPGKWKTITKYAPIAVWKDWGYFDIGTGRQLKSILFDTDTALEKTQQGLMAGAGFADQVAWTGLWNAVEAEVRREHPELEKKSDAFYKEVARRFRDIVDETQVVDGILERSDIMRSKDGVVKMATAFMGEPTTVYNAFTQAAYDVKNANSKVEKKAARKQLGNTGFALATSFAAVAAASAIADAMRDDDREKEYWEKFEEKFKENFKETLNPLSYIPFVKDVLSILQGYDVKRMDMEVVARLVKSAENYSAAKKGEGRLSKKNALADLIANLSSLVGIPASNIKRDIISILTTYVNGTKDPFLEYRLNKELYSIEGEKKRFMDLLYSAYTSNHPSYELMYDDMIESGISADNITRAMEDRMKNAAGVDKVTDLEIRYLAPKDQKAYDGIAGKIKGTDIWNLADTEYRSGIEEDIYNLMADNAKGEKLKEKAAQSGISPEDYILFKTALLISDDKFENAATYGKKENRYYDKEETEYVLDYLLPKFSQEQKADLWDNVGHWKKGNPYR